MSSLFVRTHFRVSLLALLLTMISFCFWVMRYQQPANLFWDENYHIASAQKYLHGVFFMEPHPPLGKLLIALGEGLFDRNTDDTTFLNQDHGKHIPEGFSFEGYRFFPVVLGWLSVPLVFLLLYTLSRSIGSAFLIALLYAFDNALIVHIRGAMLEGIQLFFIVGMLLLLALVHGQRRTWPVRQAGLIAASILFSAAVATKVTALVVGLAFVPVFLPLLRQPARLVKCSLWCLFSFVLVQYVVWQIHFSRVTRIMPELNNRGFYQASPEYKAILAEQSQGNPLNFPIMLRDSFRFFKRYEKGVPLLNMCKEGESGSTPYFWPLGARAISYRWDSSEGKTGHIYLQINPVVWYAGLFGLVSAGVLVLNSLLFSSHRRFRVGADIKNEWLYTYAGMWVCYMGIMISVDRVMYLYHYFIPLLFSLVLLALVLPRLALPPHLMRRGWLLPLLGLLLTVSNLGSFYFFAPLTYAWPLTKEEFNKRSLLDIWDLHCAGCPLTNHLARPWVDPKDRAIPKLRIGDLVSRDGSQEWGEPAQDLTVERTPIMVNGITYGKGIGTHASSHIRFNLGRRYFFFSGKVGMPDYLKTKNGKPGSVIFEIALDGVKIWESRRITPQDSLEEFGVPVVEGDLLELRVRDAGDGNENDHALWIDPVLR